MKKFSLETLIHAISWMIILVFPLFFSDHNDYDDHWSYIRSLAVPVSFMIVFYVNYFFLIPRFLFREQTSRYIIFNLLLLAAVGLLLYSWQRMNIPPDIPGFKNMPPPRHHRSSPPPWWKFFMREILSMIFMIGLSVAIRMSRRWAETEAARREAEKNRTEAELKNLRNQINPHFLLNTLNNIYALIAFDSEKAQQAVQELSKLLRYILYDNQQTLVPLGKEADFIRNYIELMRIRLSSHITVETRIDILSGNRTPIAPLIFISLIENAFKHGISPVEQSFIRISLFEQGKEVHCEISNSYHPKNNTDKSGSGIGLEQVSKRLELLYPGRYVWEKEITKDEKEYASKLIIQADKQIQRS